LLAVFGVALAMTRFVGEIVIWLVVIGLNFVGTLLLFYPGNLVAMYPLSSPEQFMGCRNL
jgi:formate/nitrite transporter FocA (FNT family)